MPVPISVLVGLQSNPNNIRNISVVAHVDHGKTTLSDCLISTNGIFSARNAGKIRYMDFTKEEQTRGITMKSASISLIYKENDKDGYLINLIDSPGHLDFTTEVSSALRITDGCILVVDALEGVCIQTRVVLRQAWSEKVKPVLFINKLDKLITNLHLTASEAFDHIKKILTSVNEVTSVLWAEEILARSQDDTTKIENPYDLDLDEDDGEFFSPSKGNVVFGSAVGGWGFTIQDFIEILVEKLGVKREVLNKTLWGDFFFVPKTKMIFKKKPTGHSVPMFANFVLKPIWDIFQALNPKNEAQVNKIITSLKLDIPPRELTDVNTPAQIAASILSRWLPLSDRVLSMVVHKLPSPVEAQSGRISVLWRPHMYSGKIDAAISPSNTDPSEKPMEREFYKIREDMHKAMITCDSSANADIVAFISKVLIVNNSNIVGVKGLDREGSSFIGMGRLFSGTLTRGQQIHLLGPKYNPLKPNKHRSVVTVDRLFIMMGRSLENVEIIPAGNVFGISGIEGHVLKTATLTSNPACASFDQMYQVAAPIVRVAIEVENSADLGKLREGMKMLNMADPGCEVFVQKTGEYIIAASGELHLKRCLSDLREQYAKVPIKQSAPLVSFKETIAKKQNASNKFQNRTKAKEKEQEAENEEEDSDFDNEEEIKTENLETQSNLKKNYVGTKTKDESIMFTVVAVPLPKNITKYLEENRIKIATVVRVTKSAQNQNKSDTQEDDGTSTKQKEIFLEEFKKELYDEFAKAGNKWLKKFDKIWSFGPQRCGPNILINNTSYCAKSLFWNVAYGTNGSDNNLETNEEQKLLQSLDNSIVTGFQLAVDAGPLCLEPMTGVSFEVMAIDIDNSVDRESLAIQCGPLTGQVMATMKSACKRAFKMHSPRIVEAFYECFVQVFGAENLGKVYGVLSRRRSKISKEDIKEGSEIYEITAYMPAAESFGFADELFTKTSGAAHGQLVFAHWDVLDQDPDFVPTTDEELEDSGYNVAVLGNNIARVYIDNVRKRKGLPIKEKLVKNPNQQRTRSKKK